MNKDVKIAMIVLAVIACIAILEAQQNTSLHYSPSQALPVATKASTSSDSTDSSCQHRGITLKGKVQVVDSFADLKIKYVDSFADINVQFVSSFPDDCGQWQLVSSFPDFTVEVVDSFPDIEVKKVSSFPGMN